MIRHWKWTNTGTTTTAAMGLALALSGCGEADFGPKRADYKAAHTAHYHPDINRQSPPSAAQTQPASRPVDFQFGKGQTGSPILFANGEAITVPQVLEPLYDELADKAKNLSENTYRDYLVRRVADQVNLEISRVIIFQEAKLTFPDKAGELFDKEADKLVKEIIDNRFGGIRARYEEHLKTVGLSISEVKERTKRHLMVSEYLHEHFKPLIQSPSRPELFEYYQTHKADFATPPKAEMFIIEISLEAELKKSLASATPDQIAAAQAQAVAKLRRAREELDSGVDFADVARQYSQGLQAPRGGAVGEISPGSMTARYKSACDALFKLQEGRFSEPISASDAVFLVKCGKITPAHQGTFEESQSQVKNRLMEDQFNELQRRYIAGLEAKAVIGKRNDFLLAVLSAAPRPPQYETR